LANKFSSTLQVFQDHAPAEDGITEATVNTNKPQLESLSCSEKVPQISHFPTLLIPNRNSSPYSDLDMSKETLSSRCNSLTEGEFLRGLGKSIELTEFSDFE
jgi:hypothetical protein